MGRREGLGMGYVGRSCESCVWMRMRVHEGEGGVYEGEGGVYEGEGVDEDEGV